MGSRLFLEESLVFNWQGDKRGYKLYKYTQPFLMFSDLAHGEFVHEVADALIERNLDFLIVVDIKTHTRFLNYVRARHVFMIGLTPVNYSPWQVSYPIPAFSDSYLTQYFFLKFVLRLHLHARSLNYVKLFNLS